MRQGGAASGQGGRRVFSERGKGRPGGPHGLRLGWPHGLTLGRPLGLALGMTLWLALSMGAAAQARRVVSLNLCTDQLLLLLAPQRAAAVTMLARDPRLSFAAAAARRVEAVRADAEAVLALHPDLVVAGLYGARPALALLRGRVPVEQFADATDFDGVAANIRRMAALLGAEAKGAALIAAMRDALAAVPRADRGRAILWEPAGWTAPPGSMADAVLHAAGWRNVGSGGRMSLEALLAARPDLLVTETAPDLPSLATDLLRHPALRGLPARHIPPALLICPGPYTARAAALLAG